ncbi:MAG: glycoside hydrolase family 13 protein [Faecalibacterium sp.]|jgi:glycosidase|nr:glycoside hydrolase family 13 protein [Faecalibacterium sp.]
MNLSAVLHRPTEDYIYPIGRQKLAIQLIAARDDFDSVTLLYWGRYCENASDRKKLVMPCPLRDAYHVWYRAELALPHLAAYVRYCFLLKKGAETVCFGAKGFSYTNPEAGKNFFEFLWPNESDGCSAPAWCSGQIYYQIFPERFCSGDAALNPPGTVAWGSTPTRENYMGGDLKGICQKLDYLQSLGATCLYLTPIFKAPSNHKYDTADYYEIDPQFGTKEDLSALVCAVHQRGMRILLDGVFNHCGYYFGPFQDVVKNGAASAYKDWFFVQSWPVCTEPLNYDCVGHYKWMPKLNQENPEVRRYFVDVGKYWIRTFGVDGWRLDVADEVPTSFWEQFVGEIRAEFPNVMFLGETWGDAGRLIRGNRLDCAMNYLFRDAVTDWIAYGTIDAVGFDHRINAMMALYPYEAMLRMYNPLDSHDTARFLFECGEKPDKMALAIALQMTLPGCPAIFYGDEVGISGANDPLCRQAMEWDEKRQNHRLLDWYKELIALRRRSPSLCHGAYRTCLCSSAADTFAFLRESETEYTEVVLNASAKNVCITLPMPESGTWTDPFAQSGIHAGCEENPLVSDAEPPAAMTVLLPAGSVKIYQKRKEEHIKKAARVNLDSPRGLQQKSSL